MHKTAVAIRHVAFEDLGSLEEPVRNAGYDVRYVDAVDLTEANSSMDAADLLIVLGGPVSVYDADRYPFLLRETDLLKARLAADRPTFGVCLGAQLMAAAMGARVFPGPLREIGWSSIELTAAGANGPLEALREAFVLHWHGDTFDLPETCELLCSTRSYANQAFARGPNLLALQFHPEPSVSRFEHWLVGHASELAAARMDPRSLRADAHVHAVALQASARSMMSRWLAALA